MAGSVAVHVAAKRMIPNVHGLVVVDVVEGTAMTSLIHMQKILSNNHGKNNSRLPSTVSNVSIAYTFLIICTIICMQRHTEKAAVPEETAAIEAKLKEVRERLCFLQGFSGNSAGKEQALLALVSNSQRQEEQPLLPVDNVLMLLEEQPSPPAEDLMMSSYLPLLEELLEEQPLQPVDNVLMSSYLPLLEEPSPTFHQAYPDLADFTAEDWNCGNAAGEEQPLLAMVSTFQRQEEQQLQPAAEDVMMSSYLPFLEEPSPIFHQAYPDLADFTADDWNWCDGLIKYD